MRQHDLVVDVTVKITDNKEEVPLQKNIDVYNFFY